MSQKKKSGRIGIFDSGFGGLHIARAIVRTLPQYEYVYLGDTARTPYGNRSQKTIYAFTEQSIEFLSQQGCELIIVACNTASSEALRTIQQKYLPNYASNKKVLGVLIPAAEEATKQSNNRRIGVIATESTVASQAFVRELGKLDQNIRVFQKACPLIVPFVEAGEQNSPEMETILERYLRPLIRKNIDTLILGCTHYGILEKKIRKIVGPDIAIISEAKIIPKKLEIYLEKHRDVKEMLSTRSSIYFYSTDQRDTFERLGSTFFGKKIAAQKAILQ